MPVKQSTRAEWWHGEPCQPVFVLLQYQLHVFTLHVSQLHELRVNHADEQESIVHSWSANDEGRNETKAESPHSYRP